MSKYAAFRRIVVGEYPDLLGNFRKIHGKRLVGRGIDYRKRPGYNRNTSRCRRVAK